MKTIILITSLVLLTIAVTGQGLQGKKITSGSIIFEERIRKEIKPEIGATGISGSFPNQRVLIRVLSFTPEYSFFRTDHNFYESSVPAGGQISHSPTRILFNEDKTVTFCDLKNRKIIEQKEFMTRLFLIEGSFNNPVWKQTGNSNNIAGYDCQEAVWNSSENKVTAWFTSSIPVSTGPAGYWGLPGLILKIDVNNGDKVFNALSVDPSFTEKSKDLIPKEGKQVTNEEFQNIIDQKLKELEEEAGNK